MERQTTMDRTSESFTDPVYTNLVSRLAHCDISQKNVEEEREMVEKNGEEKVHGQPAIHMVYTFEATSEHRLESVEEDNEIIKEDVRKVKKQLEYLKTIIQGPESMKPYRKLTELYNRYDTALEKQKDRLDELADAFEKQAEYIMDKDARVNAKEAALSRQITMAVAQTIQELTKRGRLVACDDITKDPLFAAKVEEVILRQLMNYGKIVDKVEECCLDMVEKVFGEKASE